MALIDEYEELLKDLGFRPQRTQVGNLSFKFEGRSFYLFVSKNDPTYFQLVYSGIWRITSPEELQEAFESCNQLTADRKVVKLFVEQDRSYVSATLELFLPEPAAARSVFMRALTSLELTGRELRERMRRGTQERSAAQLKALVRRRFFEMLADGDTAAVRVLFTEDYVCVDPATPPGGWPTGPVAAVALVAAYRGAFDSFRVSIAQQHVAGSVVTTRWSLTGVQSGPMLGLPATGAEVTLEGISIDELRGEQIALTVTSYDCGQMARRLLPAATAMAVGETPTALTA